MAKIRKKKFRLYIFFILFVAALAFLFFNEFGILKYLKLKNEVKSLQEQISETGKKNKEIEESIDSLQKKIPAKIEKTAREKYNMIREGEKVIEVREKSNE